MYVCKFTASHLPFLHLMSCPTYLLHLATLFTIVYPRPFQCRFIYSMPLFPNTRINDGLSCSVGYAMRHASTACSCLVHFPFSTLSNYFLSERVALLLLLSEAENFRPSFRTWAFIILAFASSLQGLLTYIFICTGTNSYSYQHTLFLSPPMQAKRVSAAFPKDVSNSLSVTTQRSNQNFFLLFFQLLPAIFPMNFFAVIISSPATTALGYRLVLLLLT